MRFNVVTTVNSAAADYDLTDLETVKIELQIEDTVTKDDAFLGNAITQISASAANFCNRVFQVEALTDTFYYNRGLQRHSLSADASTLQLSRFPILSVSSVTLLYPDLSTATLVQGTDYVVNAALGQLIRIDSQNGFATWWEADQTAISYVAGYGALASQSQAVPTIPFQVTVTNAAAFSIDQGVKYVIAGTALTKVASGPTVGQYAVNTATGVYTFAAADVGVQVAISCAYNNIPADLVDAVLRMITQRFQSRGRDPLLMEHDQPGPQGRKRFWVGTSPGQNGAFPPEIAGLLDGQYRVPVIV